MGDPRPIIERPIKKLETFAFRVVKTSPFKLNRYAGADRMKVEVDYRAMNGCYGTPISSPTGSDSPRPGTSFSPSSTIGIRFVGCRADLIFEVTATGESFVTRFAVDLTNDVPESSS